MAKFLNNISLEQANDIQFKTTAGTNAGKISQTGDDLVISNAVGDILLGNGSDDIYIGDGTNTVDIRFEQNMSIFADSSSAKTLTIGGSNTNLVLDSPTFSGTLTFGATTINNKLTFTTANGYILFDYEPSGDTGEYTSEVPLIKVDHNGTEKTILSRISENGAIQLGHDDTVLITAGDVGDVMKNNWGATNENVVLASEGGFYAYGFPGNDASWSNRNEFRFRSDSTTASDNGLYIGDGSNTQFIDVNRNLKNIGTIGSGAITSTGSIISSSSSAVIQTPRISMEADGTLDWGASRDYGTLTWDTNKIIIRALSGNATELQTNGATTALTLDTSQNATFAGDVNVAEGKAIKLGTGGTFQLWHQSGTNGNSFIDEQTAGELYIRSNSTIRLAHYANNTASANFNPAGAVELYHNTVKKLETTAGGVDVTGVFMATSGINLPDASPSSPSLFFNNDADTGFYRNDTGSVTFSSDGSNKIRLNSSGLEVFSGYLKSTSLDINGNADISGNLTMNNGGTIDQGTIYIQDTAAGRIGWNRNTNNGAIHNSSYNAFQAQVNTSGADGKFEIQSYNGSGSYGGSFFINYYAQPLINDYILHNGDEDTKIGFSGSDTFVVHTGGSERFKIDSSGDATFAGNIDVSGQSTDILFGDNLGAALEFKEGSNLYMRFVTTNGSEGIDMGSYPIRSNLIVGVDDTGHDVKFFGATASHYAMWDQSKDLFQVAGDLEIKNANGSNPADAGSLVFNESGATWASDMYGFRFTLEGSANELKIQSANTSTVKEILKFARDTATSTFAGNVTLGGDNPTITLNDSNGRAAAIDVVGNTFRIDDVANNAAIFTADLSTNPVQTTFSGPLSAGSNSLTAGSLDINGGANISGTIITGGGHYISSSSSTGFYTPNTNLVITAANNSSATGGISFKTNNGGTATERVSISAAGTATFAGDVSIAGDLTTEGDLIINNTSNVSIKDTIITLNSGITVSDTRDIGLMFERVGNNKFFGWDEDESYFTLAENTQDVSLATTTQLTMGTLQTLRANVHVDTLSVGSENPAQINAILDEDNMASNSATSLATQQSIKAYADTMLPKAGGTMSGAIAMGNNNITGGGTITGTTLTGTSLDINGNADISGSTTVADIITSGHIYGRSVDGEYSNLYRMGGVYFTWDSDSYGTNFNHSITSTSDGNYGDNLTMNSYGKVRINFDSNNNDSADFSIGHHTTGTANTLLTLNDSGNLTITGELEATALDINGNADISGNLSGVDTLSAEQITIDGNSTGVPLYVRSTGTVSYVQIQNSSTGTSGTGDGFTIGANGTAAYLWQRENAVLYIGTNDTTAVTIDASQNATFAGTLVIPGDIQHAGNTTTYFGFHNSDEWRVVTNSTERLEVSNNGIKLGGTGATVSSIQDQDDMASNSATALATQQSIKTYVDNQVALVAQATNLNAADDRDMAPEDYGYTNDLRVFFSTKEGLEDGSSIGSNYQDVLYLNSYSDASGGDANILAFDKSEMKIYHYQADQAATNWGTAKQLAYTDSSELVQTTGGQTISGTKTFTGGLVLDDGSGAAPIIKWRNGNDDEFSVFNNANNKLIFQQDSTTRMDLSSGGLNVVDGIQINTVDVLASIDEDDMASNSATRVPTQQSVKAYVDSSVSSAGGGDVTLAGTQTFTGSKTFSADVILQDNVELEFGTGSDVKMKFDGSDFSTSLPYGSTFSIIDTSGSIPSGDVITAKIHNQGYAAANGNTRTGLDVETTRRGWYNSDSTAGNFKISNSLSGARIGDSNLIGVKSLATLDVNNTYSGVTTDGSLTAFYGKVTTTFTTGSSPVEKGYGLRIDAPEVATNSEITTYYGAYIDGGSVSGTLTNKYALITEANAGNVGIATTSPSKTLTVGGTIQSTGEAFFNNFDITNTGSSSRFRSGHIVHFNTNRTANIFTSSEDLYITNSETDKDIIFRADNSAGGVTEYLKIDGGISSILAYKDILMANDGNNGKIKFGASQDLEIYHDGNHSFISDQGTGHLQILSSQLQVNNAGNTENMITAAENGSVTLFNDGSAKLATKSDGVDITGELQADSLDIDGVGDISGVLTTHSTVKIGATQKLYLDGGNNTYITESSADVISFYRGGSHIAYMDSAGIFSLANVYTGNSGQFRNYGGTWKASTGLTGNGFEFLNSVDGTAMTLSSTGNMSVTGDVTVGDDVFVADGGIINLGSGNDLKIYHDGSNSYIQDAGAGSLIIKGSNTIAIRSADDENYFHATANGSVKLYHNNSAKFETAAAGVKTTFAATSNTAGDGVGDIVNIGETTTVAGKIYYLNSSGGWTLTDADAESTAKGMLAVALGTSSSADGMLIRGMVTLDHDPGTVGNTLFLSTTPGTATWNPPSLNGDIVRVIGYCLDSTNGQIYFNPDGTFIEVTA